MRKLSSVSLLLFLIGFSFVSCENPNSPTQPGVSMVPTIVPALVTQFGSFGSGVTQFYDNENIAMDCSNNCFYIAEKGNERIDKFGLAGNLLLTWPVSNVGGVAVNQSGQVYVPNPMGRIQVFNSSGGTVSTLGPIATGPPVLSHIIIDSSNNIFGSNNTAIYKVDANGNTLLSWGQIGSNPGQFKYAYSLAFNHDQSLIYVADYYNSRVQVFRTDGTYQSSIFPQNEFDHNVFFSPNAIVLDSNDNLYVATDYFIFVFDLNGNALFKWEWGVDLSTQSRAPFGIALDCQRNIYLSSDYFSFVKIWKAVR